LNSPPVGSEPLCPATAGMELRPQLTSLGLVLAYILCEGGVQLRTQLYSHYYNRMHGGARCRCSQAPAC